MIAPQICELPSRPRPEQMQPVRNPPVFPGGDVVEWMRRAYCGNKPQGGIWTSTYMPGSEYRSDWECARSRNLAVRHAYPSQPGQIYLLEVRADANVALIDSMEQALEFTERYRLGRLQIEALGLPPLITPELTDWERALREYDAIQVTGDLLDEIAYAMVNGTVAPTAVHTWNCESMFAGRWIFGRMERIK